MQNKELLTLKNSILSRLLEMNNLNDSPLEAGEIYYIVMSDYPRDMVEGITSMSRQGIDQDLIKTWSEQWTQEYLARD